MIDETAKRLELSTFSDIAIFARFHYDLSLSGQVETNLDEGEALNRDDLRFSWVELDSQRVKLDLQFLETFFEILSVMVYIIAVVHIAPADRKAENLSRVMIDGVRIDKGEDLGNLASDPQRLVAETLDKSPRQPQEAAILEGFEQ